MIGAMNADGVIDPREHAAIERQLNSHPLFKGLGQTAAKTLIDLSNDAIKFAGNAIARTPAIAKGLPARIHRLAAGGGRLTPYLDDRFLRIQGLIGIACEVFALRALARGMATDDQRFKVRDFFAAIPDLALSKDELDAELYRAFKRPRSPDAQVFGELSRVANSLPDPVDRYWIVVYTLVAEMPATVPSWRVIPFIGVMQAAFQITDTDMELAAVDALTFPPAMPRPS